MNTIETKIRWHKPDLITRSKPPLIALQVHNFKTTLKQPATFKAKGSQQAIGTVHLWGLIGLYIAL